MTSENDSITSNDHEQAAGIPQPGEHATSAHAEEEHTEHTNDSGETASAHSTEDDLTAPDAVVDESEETMEEILEDDELLGSDLADEDDGPAVAEHFDEENEDGGASFEDELDVMEDEEADDEELLEEEEDDLDDEDLLEEELDDDEDLEEDTDDEDLLEEEEDEEEIEDADDILAPDQAEPATGETSAPAQPRGGLPGKLLLVGTSIGNKEDITYRAHRTLQNADVVVCEEYKVGARILREQNLSKTLLEMNEHNETEVADEIIALLREGKKVAVISDAGLPLIADPGSILVRKALALGVEPSVVPGVSSIMTALMMSGFDLRTFDFVGFLPRKPEERQAAVNELASRSRTLVILETPYRLRSLLTALVTAMPDRQATLAVNMTTPFEAVMRGTLSNLAARFAERKFKGEFVIVLAPIAARKTAVRAAELPQGGTETADEETKNKGGYSPVRLRREAPGAPSKYARRDAFDSDEEREQTLDREEAVRKERPSRFSQTPDLDQPRAERPGGYERPGRPERPSRPGKPFGRGERSGGWQERPRRDDKPGFGDRPRRDDRGGSGFGGPRRDDKPGFGGPRRDDRPSFGDRPRRDDRPSFGDRPRRDDRGGSGFGGPRRDERGGFGDRPRRDDRGGSGFGDRPRRDDRGGSGFGGPRRDDRGGSGFGNRSGGSDRPRFQEGGRDDRRSSGEWKPRKPSDPGSVRGSGENRGGGERGGAGGGERRDWGNKRFTGRSGPGGPRRDNPRGPRGGGGRGPGKRPR